MSASNQVQAPKHRRFSRAKLLVLVGVCVLLLGVVAFICGAYKSLMNGLRDIYVPFSAADLVIQHLEFNQGTWPRDWDDLHRTFQRAQTNGLFRGFHWDEYLGHVEIDFTADVAGLAAAAKTEKAPFCVISSRGHVDRFPESTDPNERLLLYFRELTARSAANKEQPQGPPPADQPDG